MKEQKLSDLSYYNKPQKYLSHPCDNRDMSVFNCMATISADYRTVASIKLAIDDEALVDIEFVEPIQISFDIEKKTYITSATVVIK